MHRLILQPFSRRKDRVDALHRADIAREEKYHLPARLMLRNVVKEPLGILGQIGDLLRLDGKLFL